MTAPRSLRQAAGEASEKARLISWCQDSGTRDREWTCNRSSFCQSHNLALKEARHVPEKAYHSFKSGCTERDRAGEMDANVILSVTRQHDRACITSPYSAVSISFLGPECMAVY